MAITSRFCFSASVRLGSIIIGVLTLIQASLLLMVVLLSTDSLTLISKTLNDWIEVIDLEGNFYKEIANNPKILITGSTIFLICLICSCILLLFGSYQCKPTLIYPFVFLYLLYILGLLAALVFLILYIKVKGNGLGDLILYSNIGGFILLYYLYTWACVLSFIQIIKELQQRLRKKLKVVEQFKLSKKKNTKRFHNHAHFT